MSSRQDILVSPNTLSIRVIHQLTVVKLLSSFSHPALVYSVADPNLMDVELAKKLNLPSLPHSEPLHQPYDCATNMLPGTPPPTGCLYSLSAPETWAKQDYINSALAAGIIHPSSSPSGGRLFLMAKKGKFLDPRNVYHLRIRDE